MPGSDINSTDSTKLKPVYTDGTPIQWDGNKATILGRLHDFGLFCTRKKLFIEYVTFRTSTLILMLANKLAKVINPQSAAAAAAASHCFALVDAAALQRKRDRTRQ